MLGVLLDRDSLDRDDIDFTALRATLPDWRLYAATAPHEVAARIAEAAVVVCNKVVLSAPALAGAKRLQLVAVAATGTNNVDLQAAARHSVAVCNVRAYATPSVVQHVFSLILALTRRLVEYRAAVDDGAWSRSRQFCLLDYPMRELTGLRLGIIGYGELGQAVAQTARQGFGMEVLVAERRGLTPRPGRLALEELLPRVDVLSLHCPLTAETHNLIGRTALATMRDDALLINTARGGIVDEAALAQALRAGRLGGAGIDVLGTEPPPVDNPLLAGDLSNLIVTPHIAWASRESRQRLVDQVAGNVAAFRAGRPQNRVTGA